MSNSTDFTIINNGINTDIQIIKHNETGFYNITKINKSIYAKKCENNNNEAPGIPGASKKLNDWFRNQSNKALIILLQKKLNNDKLYYVLEKDIKFEFKGTYVHKFLYDHILMWIDKSYAIEISIILDNIHQSANKKKNDKIDEQSCKIDEQSCKIDDLMEENKKQTKKIDDQSKKIDDLLKRTGDIYNQNEDLKEDVDELNENVEDLKEQNDDLKEDVEDLNENINDVREAFYENLNSRVPNPENYQNQHEFTLLQTKTDLTELNFLRGSVSHNTKQINKRLKDINLVNRQYNANPINLFIRFKSIIKEDNDKARKEIRANKQLSREQKKELLEKLKNNPPIKITYNTIRLNGVTVEQLLTKIKECDDERFNVDIP